MHFFTRTGLVSAFSGCLAVTLASPWLPLASLWMAFLLVWPISMLVTLVSTGAYRLASMSLPGFADLTRNHQLRFWDVTLAMGMLAAGGYAANRLLVQGVLGALTLCGQALAVALAISVFVLRPSRRLKSLVVAKFGLTVCAVSLGTLAVLADATVMPDAYAHAHLVCLIVALTAFALACLTLPLSAHRGFLAVPLVAFVLLAITNAATPKRAGESLLAHARVTSYQVLLHSFWRLTDRDADGFSPLWGGGDCNDHDAFAYPLSANKDCLAWQTEAASDGLAAPRAALQPTPSRPQVIVFVTIDAFRCGFGVREDEPLRSACPELVRLGQAGRLRLDAHTPAPVTAVAMRALHHGCYEIQGHKDSSTAILVPTLKAAGYEATVVVTHPAILVNQSIRAQFDHIDEDLVARARDGTRSTAQEVSARVLLLTKQGLTESAKPKFIWAHHFDPHAPYLRFEGGLMSRSRLRDYTAEVKRTDAALGWLADQLAQLQRADEVLLIVTSDHGEEFGEHGRIRHGGGLYEETLRIPVLAWSPGSAPARYVASGLPASLVEMPAFLSHVISGAPFAPSGPTLGTAWLRLDPQIAVNEAGWKLIHHYVTGHQELYDLGEDPLEQTDLAYLRPDKTMALGQRLLSLLRSSSYVCEDEPQSPTSRAQPLQQTRVASP